MKVVIAVVLSALVGCGSSGRGNAPSDGGAIDGGAPRLATDVVGRYHATCRSNNADIAIDLSQPQWTIRAWVPDGNTHRLVTGAGSVDGSFVLHDVPVGATYALQISELHVANTSGDQRYWVTDQRVLDLHSNIVIRCNPPPARATAAIPVTVDLTNMSGFAINDFVEIGSLALGSSAPLTVSGSTTVHASFTLPQGTPLVDAAAGDDYTVNHTRTASVSNPNGVGGLATTIVDQFSAPGVTMQGGAPLAISGAFRNLTPNRTGTLTLDLAGLETGYDQTTSPGELQICVVAEPADRVGGGQLTNAVVWRFITTGLPRTGTSTLPYSFADPYPDSWTRTVTITASRNRLVRLSTSTSPDTPIGVGAPEVQTVTYGNAITVGHVLNPPDGITVGGTDFGTGGAVAFDGQAPVVLHWNAVADAQLYQITLAKVPDSPTSVPLLDEVHLMTADTSVTVPAALIEAGARYQLLAEAIQTTNNAKGGELLVPAPQVAASVPSARFRFLPSCGDGIVQAGEDCDTRGESATCNADCTTAVCGDGVVNTTAGEACDTVQASDTCTANCKKLP